MSDWQRVWVVLKKNSEGKWITVGPMMDEELKSKIASRELSLDTWVWKRGMTNWAKIGSLNVIHQQGDDWTYDTTTRTGEVEFFELKWSDQLAKPQDESDEIELAEDDLSSL